MKMDQIHGKPQENIVEEKDKLDEPQIVIGERNIMQEINLMRDDI